jgi:putative ABC transport system substrate-binding protein
MGEDPVGLGLVRSFNRPGSNITGFTFLTGELGAKRLGLLLELITNAKTVALLVNPNNSTADSQIADVRRTADTMGRQLKVFRAASAEDIEPVFASMSQQKIEGLIVANDPFFDSQRDRLMALSAMNRLPAIYHIREFPASGGLMSYGASLADAYREVGRYAGRILSGERPSDLPVLQPTRFELVINATTAKALRLDIPATLLARADEVIE